MRTAPCFAFTSGRADASARFLRCTLVIVPALNEAECVAQVVRHWLDQGAARVRVVDNGSNDATAAMARNAGAEVVSELKRGYGAAAWRGLQNIPPGIEWVLFSSADGSDRLESVAAVVFQSAVDGGADFVLGERVSSSDSRSHLTAVQRFGNWLCCRLLSLGWGCKFRDMASLRLIRREVIPRLGLTDRGFGWNVEMQVRAVEEGLRIVEVPVTYRPRQAGTPKISGNPLGVVRAAWGMIRIIVRLYRQRRLRLQTHPVVPAQPWSVTR
jgi:glycosyltransferase involved in cell wall biosynthesis